MVETIENEKVRKLKEKIAKKEAAALKIQKDLEKEKEKLALELKEAYEKNIHDLGETVIKRFGDVNVRQFEEIIFENEIGKIALESFGSDLTISKFKDLVKEFKLFNEIKSLEESSDQGNQPDESLEENSEQCNQSDKSLEESSEQDNQLDESKNQAKAFWK